MGGLGGGSGWCWLQLAGNMHLLPLCGGMGRCRFGLGRVEVEKEVLVVVSESVTVRAGVGRGLRGEQLEGARWRSVHALFLPICSRIPSRRPRLTLNLAKIRYARIDDIVLWLLRIVAWGYW